MGIFDFFSKAEALLAVDIGSSGVKMLELDLAGDKPRLVTLGFAPLAEEVFSNNLLGRPEPVAERLTQLLESNAVGDKRVVTAMPGPGVFTKRVTMPAAAPNELRSNIQFEAGSFIPHNIEEVRLDYHVIGSAGKGKIDVLVVAVKNEVIDSFSGCLSLCGLEAAVVDVDYYALQNMFELSYPEFVSGTTALVNIGARYSSINICRGGQSLFTGDITVGGKVFTEAIAQETGVALADAENVKRAFSKGQTTDEQVKEIIDRTVEQVASELNRQLSFFWNASGAEDGIERIMVTGGGALVPGLVEELREKTGVDCVVIDPFRGIEMGEEVDQQYLKELAPLMSICVGMGIRQPGDKETPELE